MAIIAFMASAISYGQETDKKSSKARENVKEAQKDEASSKKDLKEAQKDSVAQQKFKKDSEKKFEANEKSIANLKVKIAKEKKASRAKYEKQLAGLEQKNTDLKKKLDDYNAEGKEKWAAFKTGFERDMDKLGKDLKGFTVGKK